MHRVTALAYEQHELTRQRVASWKPHETRARECEATIGGDGANEKPFDRHLVTDRQYRSGALLK